MGQSEQDCNRAAAESAARVLVFPCGTEIGLEIHRALAHSTHAVPVGASSVASHHGRMVFRELYEGLPFVTDKHLLAALKALVQEADIGFIYPAHDDAVLALAGREDEVGCPVLSAPRESALICRSKLLTNTHFRGLLPVPALYDIAREDYPLPLFLKPEWGQGSKGVLLAHTHAQVHAALERDPSLIAFAYLPGAEYTVDCFTDSAGALRFCAARERIRRANGISMHTEPVQLPEAEDFARIINAELAMRGAWFFQLKRDAEGVPSLMEIAPRVSGGMGIWRAQGVNLPLLTVFDAMQRPVHIARQAFHVDMDRALVNRFKLDITFSHVYIDFDDTFHCNGQLHALAVLLLTQCRARGIQTHLVTRHQGDIEARLAALGLRGLFDSVQHLQHGEPKSACIAHRDAIFIDDSFAERREVQQALGIPVFGVDAIEALIDWRA